MRTSSKGLAAIRKHEGFRARAYKDVANIWTIGYGHTSAAGAPRVHSNLWITRQEGEEILARDIAKFERGVLRLVKVDLNQGQVDALVSFAFNVGLRSFKKSTLLRLLNRGDYYGASNQFIRWNKAKVNGRLKPVRGLTNRRKAEKKMFLSQMARESLAGSRTVHGTTAAGAGIGANEKSDAIAKTYFETQDSILSLIGSEAQEVSYTLQDIAHLSDWISTIATVLTVIGIGYALYARIDDHRNTRR